jgi:hypothetical protein
MTGILNALFASLAGPQNVTVIQSFTATGEWVCPTGVTEVEWLIVASGGGGGFALWWATEVAVVVLVVSVLATGLSCYCRNDLYGYGWCRWP